MSPDFEELVGNDLDPRERARLEGGEFEAGPTADGFRVRATLPARRPVATHAVST